MVYLLKKNYLLQKVFVLCYIRRRFDTEQRQRFTNIDAEDIKMSQSQTFKKLPETYKPPTEKFESMTSQKVVAYS